MTPSRCIPLALAALLSAGPLGVQAQSPASTSPARPAASVGAPASDRADAAFTTLDRDRNGALSRQEFRTGWLEMRQLAAIQARLRAQFEAIDTNRSGGIDAGEYPNLVLVKHAGTSAPALSSFDANGNQKLEFGEYVALVRKLAPAPAKPAPSAPGAR